MWFHDGPLDRLLGFPGDTLVISATVAAAILCRFIVRSRASQAARWATLVALILICLWMRAPELLLYLAAQLLMILLAAAAMDRWRGLPQRSAEAAQLLLALLAMTVLASLLPGLYQVDWFLTGAAFGIGVAAIEFGVTAQRRWPWKTLLATACAIGIVGVAGGLIDNFDLAGWLNKYESSGRGGIYHEKTWQFGFVLGMATIGVVTFAAWAACRRASGELAKTGSRTHQFVRSVLIWPILAALALFITTPILEAWWRFPRLPAFSVAPQRSESYGSLLAIARKLGMRPLEHSHKDLTEEDCDTIMEVNQDLIPIVEQLLDQPIDFAIDYSPLANLQTKDERIAIRKLHAFLLAQFVVGEWDESIHQQLRAIRSLLKLARQLRQSPLIIHYREAIELEQSAFYLAFLARDRMTRNDFDEFLPWVSNTTLDASLPKVISATFDDWSLRVFGWREAVSRAIVDDGGFERMTRSDELWQTNWRAMLVAELALRQYHNVHGKYPSQLIELVPDFLDALPTDTEYNAPICYHTTDGEWPVYVYGRGYDGIDNGGWYDPPRRDDVSLARIVWDLEYRFDLDPLPQIDLPGEESPYTSPYE